MYKTNQHFPFLYFLSSLHLGDNLFLKHWMANDNVTTYSKLDNSDLHNPTLFWKGTGVS